MGAGHGHGLVAVGPGRAGSMLLAGGYGLNPLPVQPAKIHCPPPRDDTLTRERLNSWLELATAGRLALIVAEAGFGKTTLLADWARQTSRMTAWYRLESDDRDWLTFIRHIVASGRELHPDFAPDTFSLLPALESGGTTRQELIQCLVRETAAFGTTSSRGLTLILDDYHVVDGFSETEPIVRALLDRTAAGFSVVIATRSMPTFGMGRLRARGGVMTLEGSDLCFDVSETARLFRDAYHQPLDEDVVSDLFDRTEGWAALLTLVRAGLAEQRSPDARALVAHLSPSQGDLYDFLAEEVFAILPPELQHFLTRAALLTGVDVASAMLVDDRPEDAVAASIAECERLGLLARPDRTAPHRFHALVREFLEARLTADIGAAAVRELHHMLGSTFEPDNWVASATHFGRAGDERSVARVLDAAVPSVLGTGQFEQARQFIGGTADEPGRPAALLLRSRIELERGNIARAFELAQLAHSGAKGSPLAGLALLNLAASRSPHGFHPITVELAGEALRTDLSPADRQIAEASLEVWTTQEDGNLAAAVDHLAELAVRQDAVGHRRYAGVTRLNQALLMVWLGRARDAVKVASKAELDLAHAPSSAERVAATAVRVNAQVQLGQTHELDRLAALIDTVASPTAQDEATIETARLFGDYGSLARAETYLARLSTTSAAAGYKESWAVIAATLALRRGDAHAASECLDGAGDRLPDAAGRFRIGLVRARIYLAAGDSRSEVVLQSLAELATCQQSRLEDLLVGLLRARLGVDPDAAIGRLMPDETHLLSVVAEECCRMLPDLREESRGRILEEAQLRPERWTSALRLVFASDPTAATILAAIGNREDVAAIRSAAGSRKWLRPLAADATRRLAPRILIRDLGAVSITIGDGGIERTLRRKVLGLLCYVSSRPGMAATRDEALEAIWPDLGPDTAVNSLHQTIYYLRRIFEPTYKEGMSAGYVAFDGEVLTLDPGLVDSLSRQCWRLLGEARGGDQNSVRRLVATYRGTYALDSAYEEWAVGYRENLHAAVLAAVETELTSSMKRGDVDGAIELAQAVLAVDRAADAIELQLLRAYKAGGRHAAAAEQYAHYAAYVRGELGAEPPPFGEI